MMSESPDQSQLVARLEQAQSLRELAHDWYALSVACRCVGAMIERAIKDMLYEPNDNSSVSESGNDNPN